ncbi:MAG: DegV family protein [Clostridia bacterium]|jgi:EDD domain protein, degV family|nr:DegV family protein [Clostridia bacterium]
MIQITSDSTCDLGELAPKHGIRLMPLKVILDTETFKDGVDIAPADIFAFVEKTGMLPKTSAPGIEDFRELFSLLTANGDEVIHFTISSKASASYSCALAASREFDGKVRVVDSLALSSGQGLLVMKAVDLRDAGKSAAEIEETVNALRARVNTSFVPDRLEYLYKGGRCSKMEMYGANILKIHPMIDMKDGQLGVKKKYRGKMTVCIKSYIEELKAAYPVYDKTRCFITHSSADAELVELAREMVQSEFDFDEVVETVAGSVITGHCGRNTLGVLFIHD